MRPFLKLVDEYLDEEPRDLKKVWKIPNWQGIILSAIAFFKEALTETTSTKRRKVLIQLAAFLLIAHEFLGEDKEKDKEAINSIIPKQEEIEKEATEDDTLKALLG